MIRIVLLVAFVFLHLGAKKSDDPCSGKKACQAAIQGRTSFEQKKYREASGFFSLAAKGLPELSSYFLLKEAQALLENKDFISAKEKASALLNITSEPMSSQFKARIHKILAEIAYLEKDHRQAVKYYDLLFSRGLSDQKMLLKYADSLDTIDENKKSLEIIKHLHLRFPLSDEASNFETQKGHACLFLDFQENIKRFDKLIQNLAFERVILDVDNLLKKESLFTTEEKSQLENYALKALVLNNRFEKALERARTKAQSKKAIGKDLENYAWVLGKLDRFKEASDYYMRYSNIAKEPEEKAKGCFFAGFSLYEGSHYVLAEQAWQRCKDVMENSRYYENFMWYQALSSLLRSDHEKAHPILTNLIQKFKKSPELDKYIYFSGLALHGMNKKEEGNSNYKNIIGNKNPSYYILLANKALGKVTKKSQAIPTDAFSSAALACKSKVCNSVLLLHHLGFSEDAHDIIEKHFIPAKDKLALFQYTGNYHEAWRRSYMLKPEMKIENDIFITSPSIRVSYPEPFRPIVYEMSQKYGVQVSFLYTIMNLESGFLHTAKSHRGALGLMQMMPFVAQDLASSLSLKQFSTESLYDPKISIELGTLLLATHQRQFEKMPLVFAAYNAGPPQVQKWQDRFGHYPSELLVERIPFKETRDYVKKALFYIAINNALEGKSFEI